MTRRRQKGIHWPSLIMLLALIILYFAIGGGARQSGQVATPGDKEAVAAYIAQHGRLPDYYITKAQARALGWEGGSVDAHAPGKLIGGDIFGNYEGLLPEKAGRIWRECDVGSWGQSSRGAQRLVYSDDGLIYYTPDHYESFEQIPEGV